MQCEHAQECINSLIAVEIDDVDFELLSAHLAECRECRACAVSWLKTDRRLTRAIVPKRITAQKLVDQVVGQLENHDRPPSTHQPPHIRNWLSIALATAAGFLLATLLFEPWQDNGLRTVLGPLESTDPTPHARLLPSIARLVAATGPVRMRTPGADAWVELADHAAFEFESSTEVETGPQSRCEIVTSNGNILRMNTDTNMVMESQQRVRVRNGQLWCRAAQNAGLELVAERDADGDSNEPPLGVVSCPSDSSFVAELRAQDVRIHAATGSLRLVTITGEHAVEPGQRVSISADGIVTAEQVASALLAVGWMDALLVRGEHTDPDLDLRVNALLAQMGRTKASFLLEQELRGLGEHCVLPLTKFVQSDISRETPERRRKSMRVIADASPFWNIENLIGLLSDTDSEIRVLAATALLRLTGESNGRRPDQWSAELPKDDPVLSLWADWWQNRSELYPPLNSARPQQPF